MDTKDLKGLMEAYTEVYAPQEVDEAVKGTDPEMRKAASAERRGGDKPLSKKAGEANAAHMARKIRFSDKVTKAKGHIPGYAYAEEVENVDEATAMAKRGYDEAPIRQKIAKSTGGGAAADRASALEKKSTFGDANKEKQRQNLARAQRGDFRKTTSSSPGLQVGQYKSNDPAVKAKQAARGAQRGALTPAEKKQFNREEFDIFDIVLEFLQAEGIAKTLEEAQEIMANELDADDIEAIIEATYSAKAAREGKDIGKPGKAFAKIAKEAGKRYGSKERGEKVAGAVLAKLRAKRG